MSSLKKILHQKEVLSNQCGQTNSRLKQMFGLQRLQDDFMEEGHQYARHFKLRVPQAT